VDNIVAKSETLDIGSSDVDTLVTIIERLDSIITDKDVMIKRLQQAHKVL